MGKSAVLEPPVAAVGGGPRSAPPYSRLLSLDVFRGLTIASMVMVNNQSSVSYSQLRHASWNGITFTDLVFPFFVWIVGLALTLSTARRVEQGQDKAMLLRHAVKRAAIIFGIGLFLNGFPNFDLGTLRIPGVLQRIAVCYLIATLIFLYTGVIGQVIATIALLAAYFALMHPHGYEVDTNFSDQVDRALLSGHLYRPTRDPEGFVSTLPAIATCLFGILAGHLLRYNPFTPGRRVAYFIFGGNILMLLACLIDPVQPINKNIWTVSYTLLTAGLASIVFGLVYWICDVKGWSGRWSKPFLIFGMNAMAVYIFHGLLGRMFGLIKIGGDSLRTVVYNAFAQMASPPNAALLYSMIHVAASFAFAYWLYRGNRFLKF